jgi:hypothetical protein
MNSISLEVAQKHPSILGGISMPADILSDKYPTACYLAGL